MAIQSSETFRVQNLGIGNIAEGELSVLDDEEYNALKIRVKRVGANISLIDGTVSYRPLTARATVFCHVLDQLIGFAEHKEDVEIENLAGLEAKKPEIAQEIRDVLAEQHGTNVTLIGVSGLVSGYSAEEAKNNAETDAAAVCSTCTAYVRSDCSGPF